MPRLSRSGHFEDLYLFIYKRAVEPDPEYCDEDGNPLPHSQPVVIEENRKSTSSEDDVDTSDEFVNSL